MPCVWVGFRVDPPIREIIGEAPNDIELIKKNGSIVELHVLIGEERTEKIKNSDHFKKIITQSEEKWIEDNPGKTRDTTEKSKNFINKLKSEIRSCSTQRANYFINQLNYRLDSATYSVQFKELAILKFTREIQFGTSAYVKSDYITDIFDLNDADNELSRLITSYSNGLRALKNEDLVSAYKFFYLAFPEGYEITNNVSLNLDLRILRHGASHNILRDRTLQTRAKQLLGDSFVRPDKTDPSKTYAYIDMTEPRHMALFKEHLPIIRNAARDYLDMRIQSHPTV
ncbi:MAG: hypothetical protein MUO26_13480 [Methanotrichaceae archaeon]|nr:hypothetical protein [Methanotrichaceae archaeon]